VVGVVRFANEIGERELELVCPEPAGRVAWCETKARPEEEQDVGRLTDDLPAGFQKRRRERRPFDVLAFEMLRERRHAAALLLGDEGSIHVISACVFQREPHVFGAALDTGPVVELVDHPESPDRQRSIRIAQRLHDSGDASRRYAFSATAASTKIF
jgi:hypothetical protein